MNVLLVTMPEEPNIEICAPQRKETANLINLTEASGVLHGVGVAHALEGKIYLDIDIDGECAEHDIICTGSSICENTGITFSLPFKESIKVDAQNKSDKDYVRVWASLTIDNDHE